MLAKLNFLNKFVNGPIDALKLFAKVNFRIPMKFLWLSSPYIMFLDIIQIMIEINLFNELCDLEYEN